MVATPTSIFCSKESLPVQRICARYRGRSERARWGQNNSSVAQPAEYFRKGVRTIRVFPGKHRAVRFRETALRSPCHHFWLGRRLQHEAKVMHLVSYSPHPLDFTFNLYQSSRASKAWCYPTRSPLAYFISFPRPGSGVAGPNTMPSANWHTHMAKVMNNDGIARIIFSRTQQSSKGNRGVKPEDESQSTMTRWEAGNGLAKVTACSSSLSSTSHTLVCIYVPRMT